MANRFNLNITNIQGDTWNVQITQEGTTGDDPLDVSGNIIMDSDRLNNPRENIRRREAQIFLEADQTTTFSELFTEQPKQWRVEVTEGVDTFFVGWIENDTIIEDWVNDKWVVQCTANDGLKDIQNVGYADADGNLYAGTASLREILLRCLEKTGLDLNVAFVQTLNTNDQYPLKLRTSPPASGATYIDFFDQTIDQQTFVQDDGATASRVGDVLRNILFAANAALFQYAGRWNVVWLLQIPSTVTAGNLDFRVYNSAGVLQGSQPLPINQTIGSQINGFLPHWADENQRLQRRPSLGTAKAVYVFGPLGDILTNNELVNNGTTIAGWTINQAGTITLNANPINTVTFGLATTSEQNPALTSAVSVTTIKAGQRLKWRCFVSPKPPDLQFYNYRQRVRIILQQTVGGSTTYYLDENNDWVTGTRRIEFNAIVNLAPDTIEFGFDTVPAPVEGTIQLLIYPVDNNSGDVGFVTSAEWKSISIGAIAEADVETQFGIQGQRITTPSPVTYEPEPVQIGDGLGTLYRSTLLEDDGTTPTQFGYARVTNPLDDATLYETNVVDLLILQNRIAKFFTGAVFGYVPFFSRVAIDGLTGVFMVTGWSYDVGRNVTELELWEVFFLQNDILDPPPFFTDYEIQPVSTRSDQNIKPVIRG